MCCPIARPKVFITIPALASLPPDISITSLDDETFYLRRASRVARRTAQPLTDCMTVGQAFLPACCCCCGCGGRATQCEEQGRSREITGSEEPDPVTRGVERQTRNTQATIRIAIVITYNERQCDPAHSSCERQTAGLMTAGTDARGAGRRSDGGRRTTGRDGRGSGCGVGHNTNRFRTAFVARRGHTNSDLQGRCGARRAHDRSLLSSVRHSLVPAPSRTSRPSQRRLTTRHRVPAATSPRRWRLLQSGIASRAHAGDRLRSCRPAPLRRRRRLPAAPATTLLAPPLPLSPSLSPLSFFLSSPSSSSSCIDFSAPFDKQI